jgi:hypothetical protein
MDYKAYRVLTGGEGRTIENEIPSFSLKYNTKLVKFFGLDSKDIKVDTNSDDFFHNGTFVRIHIDKVAEAIRRYKELDLCPCVVDSLIEDLEYAYPRTSEVNYYIYI